ncbi:MAG: PadR family transcriptional regulator [Candidatus Micrarchaeia archaeon]
MKSQTNAADRSGYMNNEFRHMLIKFIVLKKVSSEDTYAYKLLKDIEGLPQITFFCKDKKKLKNDIYNAISALSKDGYIKVSQKRAGNKIRNYYALTSEGRKSIRGIKENFESAVRNIKRILRV